MSSKTASKKETPAYTPRKMQLATILSDLNSLRASDTRAARALVSARAPPPPAAAAAVAASGQVAAADANVETREEQTDLLDDYRGNVDLERAFQLSRLHRTVKLAYMEPGDDFQADEEMVEERGQALPSLQESRESVRQVARSFGFDSASLTNTHESVNKDAAHGDEDSPQEYHSDENDEELAAWS